MQEEIKDILELLKENFPKIEERILIKVIFTLKARHSQYKSIGFSRCESDKFKCWEATLQKIIYFLREYWLIEFTWRRLRSKWVYLCNLYKLSDPFIDMFERLEFFTKSIFQYINPLEFMRKYFSYKFKSWIYSFKVKWQKYIIQTKWKYKWVIYWTLENKIINPYQLLT